MATLITGSTGYLGSYVLASLTEEAVRTKKPEPLYLLIRPGQNKDSTLRAAQEKLYRAMQLHWSEEAFLEYSRDWHCIEGDITLPGLGLSPEGKGLVLNNVDSVLHIAASLNRKSEKECLNTNLRGTLSMINLARELQEKNGKHGLRRYTHVSTVAVCGERQCETVLEDTSVDWHRSDYDPYGRTKKFCEHMARELLPDASLCFLRPSMVIGDSRHPRTTQFDMVRAFCVLADLPAVPMDPSTRLDIVNADFVGEAIAKLHLKPKLEYDTYHLSSGASSPTAKDLAQAMKRDLNKEMRFVSPLQAPFGKMADWLGAYRSKKTDPKLVRTVAGVGALLKVFWPYITFDTVFDNTRVVTELNHAPVQFTRHAAPLYTWSKAVNFKYPYVSLQAPQAQSHTPTPRHAAKKKTSMRLSHV